MELYLQKNAGFSILKTIPISESFQRSDAICKTTLHFINECYSLTPFAADIPDGDAIPRGDNMNVCVPSASPAG